MHTLSNQKFDLPARIDRRVRQLVFPFLLSLGFTPQSTSLWMSVNRRPTTRASDRSSDAPGANHALVPPNSTCHCPVLSALRAVCVLYATRWLPKLACLRLLITLLIMSDVTFMLVWFLKCWYSAPMPKLASQRAFGIIKRGMPEFMPSECSVFLGIPKQRVQKRRSFEPPLFNLNHLLINAYFV